jgi:hypothetical protein
MDKEFQDMANWYQQLAFTELKRESPRWSRLELIMQALKFGEAKKLSYLK